MKIVSVVGKKNSGKTTLSMKIINELTKRGYNVASVKHSHHLIEMDKENTDTWKHKQAGSNLVVGVGSTTFFNSKKEHDLNRILYLIKHFEDFDFVIVEGYKKYNYPKIITSPEVRDKYTIKEVDSFTIDEKGISELADLIEEKGHDIINTLFFNDCGFTDGESIASEIREGNISNEDLDQVVCYLSIDDKVIGLNRFISDYIKQAILGILNTLDIEEYGSTNMDKIELLIDNKTKKDKKLPTNAYILINNKKIDVKSRDLKIISNSVKSIVSSLKLDEDAETIDLRITNIFDYNLINAEVDININKKPLFINEFVKGILKETIFSIIKLLKISKDIKEIQIVVENR